MMMMMSQYPHIDDDNAVPDCSKLMMKMYDVVPKLPMTYKDSSVNCTAFVVVVVDEEYLPS